MELVNCSMVLEGGAARGLFTSGVLDYLMEQDFYTKYVVGVSAGACNAVDYVSRQIGRTRDCFIQTPDEEPYIRMENVFHRKPVYDMDLVFDKYPNEIYPFDFETYFASKMQCEMVVTNCQTGKAEYMDAHEDKTQFMNKYPNEIYPFDFETYFASKMQCEMVVTNCQTGKAEYMDAHEDKTQFMKVCRASSSMPLFTDIVEIHGIPYMDGGIADSVPLRRAVEMGYRKHIVVLTKRKGYRKKNSRVLNLATYRRYQEYPEFVKAVVKRPTRYNRMMDVIDRLEEEGKIFVLRPQIKPVSRMETDSEKLLELYQHGYEMMEKEFERLKAYLG